MTRTWTNVLGAVVLALVAGTAPGGTGAAGATQESEAAAARITLAEFKKLFDQNAAIVLDVRNDEAYKAGHFPGAILVPLETVSSRAAEWKGARKPIITYCS